MRFLLLGLWGFDAEQISDTSELVDVIELSLTIFIGTKGARFHVEVIGKLLLREVS